MTGKFQNHINGLRALAVIGVILFHFKLMGVDSGFVGVDIFFVISGYLMTRILLEKESKSPFSYFSEFWMARIRRIAPALIVLTIVCMLIFTSILLFPDYKKFLRSNVTANLFFSNYFFLAQSSYFDTEAYNNPLLHTWSLSVEWQFYLIYPFLIYPLRKCSFATKFSFISALAAASYFYCGLLTQDDATEAYFALSPRAWEFFIGAAVYLAASNSVWSKKIQSTRFFKAAGLLSLLVIFLSLSGIDARAFPGWVAAIPVLACGLIVLNSERSMTNTLLSLRPLQLIGNLSYSLYLWHWPIYVYFVMAVAVDRPVSFVEKLVGLLISLALALASYKFVEQPFRVKAGYWKSNKVVAVWIFSIVISVAALAITQKSTETSYRLPAYLMNAEKALVDKNPRQSECFLDRHQVAAQNNIPKLCAIGAEKSNHIDAILWGDSFADAIQPMVNEVLLSNHLSGVVSTLAGCLPLDKNSYKNESNRNEFNYCDKGLNKKTFEVVVDTPSLKYIFFTANWNRYDEDVLNNDFALQVCTLKKLNRTPILIGPVPSPNYDVPRQWGRMELKSRTVIDNMTFARSSAAEAEKKFTQLLANITSSCGEIPVIMPSATYCEKDDCFSVKNGQSLYVDSTHLSSKGAMLMKDSVENVLLKKLAVH